MQISNKRKREEELSVSLVLNILRGETTQNNLNLDPIADIINTVDQDLVALQEVGFKTVRVTNHDIRAIRFTITLIIISLSRGLLSAINKVNATRALSGITLFPV